MSLKILALSGSLRKKSFNTALLRAAQELAPHLQFEFADISQFSLYNEEVYEKGFPPEVATFRTQIKAADGILIATPEYNHSVPGVLKNAIDWASRPPEQPFDGKAVAILGASPGMLGTVRAQAALRPVLTALGAVVLSKPEIFVGKAHEKIDANGKLTDEKTKSVIKDLVTNLEKWIAIVKRG